VLKMAVCWIVVTSCLLVTSSAINILTPLKNNPDAFSKPSPTAVDPAKPSTSQVFPFHAKLDDNYDLHWAFNDSHITFEVIVKTTGYVGLGISDNGRMYPADVVLGWVKDGKVQVSDRHTVARSPPMTDLSQDWHLVSGEETGGYTRICVARLIDTCDVDDKTIKEGTTRVIYAYGSSDDVTYHGGESRGSRSLLLLDPPTQDKKPDTMPDDVITYDFLNYNFSVPAQDTYYRCTMWQMPDLGSKHHVIRFSPVIQAGHEKLVHHMILYYCASPLPAAYVGSEHQCYQHQPRAVDDCDNVFVAWAIGGQSFDFPKVAGVSMGTQGDPGYFKLETHYDNPDMRADFVDNSGIRLHLTQQLRQHDAGFLEVGVHVDKYQIIPPKNPNFLSTGYCQDTCLEQGLAGKEIYVFSGMLHSHLIGAKMKTRHFRNGTELPPISVDDSYDFNFQEHRYLPQERLVKAGDSLITECVYNSMSRSGLTVGGLSSREEMCLSFLVYYPRVPLSRCMSSQQYNILKQYTPDQVGYYLNHLDWTNQTSQDQFRSWIDESPIRNVCTAGANVPITFDDTITDKPTIVSELSPPQSHCQG